MSFEVLSEVIEVKDEDHRFRTKTPNGTPRVVYVQEESQKSFQDTLCVSFTGSPTPVDIFLQVVVNKSTKDLNSL